MFYLKIEFSFGKRVIAGHMSLKHLIVVIRLFFSILVATGYVRHNKTVQKSKI